MKKIISLLLIFAIVFGSASMCFAAQKKYVALTFDDGPGPYTAQILDVLKQKQAKATFFVLGSRAKQYPKVMQRIYSEGHQIGLHSFDHPDFFNIDKSAQQWQISKSVNAVNNAIGTQLSDFVFRPPYGNTDKTIQDNIQLPFIIWTVDSKDWENHSADETYNNIIKSVFDGAIVLQHDIQKCNIEAVARVIDTLKAKGYEFVTIDELFYQKGTMPRDGVVYGSVRGPKLFADTNCMDFGGVKVKDIELGAWYFDAAEAMLREGYMSLDNGLFYPDRPMKRIDVVELLYKAAGSPAPAEKQKFTDVKANDAVAWAAANGITRGYTDGSFKPDRMVTRQDFACFFMRYDEWKNAQHSQPQALLAKPVSGINNIVDYNCINKFADSDAVSSYAVDSICLMVKRGLLTGDNQSRLMPLDFISKSQAAAILNRMN